MTRSKLRRKRRNPKIKIKDTEKEQPERIGSFFLDSGAHSLFNVHANPVARSERYAYYETDDFWDYVDDYAEFVKQNLPAIDYYANVDVIHNPELSWDVLKYLEQEHGLAPVPVIHMNTSVKWLRRHLEEGYDFIGLGGVALEGTRTKYINWADSMFSVICEGKDRLPCVRVHGFAMTAWDSLTRYPWWSVDSASWAKAGGFGMIFVPKKLHGKYSFEVKPYSISISEAAGVIKMKSSYQSISRGEKQVVEGWLDEIDMPLGSIDDNGDVEEWGVLSHHAARKIANLRFFQRFADSLPEWPWPFTARPQSSFGIV